MTDKKILTTIIKRLDRVIALLDNCYDTGEMSESTSRRLVEMLHTSISEIYALGREEEEIDNVDDDEISLTVVDASTDVVSAIEQDGIIQDSIQDTVELPTSTIDEQIKEIIQESSINDEQPVIETIVSEEIEEIEEKTELEAEKEEEIIPQINLTDDTLIELESPISVDYFPSEDINNQTIIDAQPPVQIEEEPKVETIVEQPTAPVIDNEPSVAVLEEEEKLMREKAQLNDLRNQLEMERKRLEQELLSWQKERLKREEEMKAAEQLLTALEAETQKRKSIIKENQSAAQPIQQYSEPVKVKVTTTVAEPKKSQPITNSKATLGEKLQEKKQFLYDSLSNDDLITQGFTPIADLTKSIGINDKFQFIKELFGGDSDRYTDTIRTLNNFDNVEEAFNYIETIYNWDKNNDAVKRIVLLVRRRYMQ